MKSLLSLLFVLFAVFNINSQDLSIEKLQKIKEKLVLEKNKIADSIKKIDARLNYLKTKEIKSNILGNEFTKTRTKLRAPVKAKPNLFSNIIGYIPKGELIQVYNYFDDGYWSIKYDSLIGYTNDSFISNKREFNDIRKKYRKTELLKKYGNELGSKIFNRQFWIGMTSELARESLGAPDNINKSKGSWGLHEQWVYSKRNLFLYFEDGELTSYQN